MIQGVNFEIPSHPNSFKYIKPIIHLLENKTVTAGVQGIVNERDNKIYAVVALDASSQVICFAVYQDRSGPTIPD